MPETTAVEDHNASIESDLVVTKYKTCGALCNKVLQELCTLCTEDKSVRDLCIKGDEMLHAELKKIWKKGADVKKGIAFPTCISVNNCICHYSPILSDPDSILKKGDMIKIDLGAHLDGFIAVVAHTLVIGASPTAPETGKKADVMQAAHYASQAALRLVLPGKENMAVTENVSKIAKNFSCKPIEGMLSHQLQRFKIDGEKTIIQNPSESQRKDHSKVEFNVHDVYAVDVLISTGEGVGREQDTRTTIFKKTEETYNLKMKTSKAFFREASQKHKELPFNLRNFEDEKKAKMGIVECLNHKLIEPFQVLYEKKDEFVAQFKFTVLLMKNGPQVITGLPFDADSYKSEHSIDDEVVQKLLTTSIGSKSKNKKKPKKAVTANAAGAEVKVAEKTEA